MNKKFNIVILLFCFVIHLSACNAKEYEIELLKADIDVSFEEMDESVIDLSDADLSESITVLREDEPESYYFVHICGAVVNPGVYEVASDSRIFEVLNLAGGFTFDAATDAVNLAMAVVDGSKIQIPTIEEINALLAVTDGQAGSWISSGNKTEADAGNSDGTGNDNTSPLTDMVNINTASLEALMTLPGIGKAKAESIIIYREEKGKFNVIEDIMKITGIKDAVFSKIKDRICI